MGKQYWSHIMYSYHYIKHVLFGALTLFVGCQEGTWIVQSCSSYLGM